MIKKYEEELLSILESNIPNKAHYVNSLVELYPDSKSEILESFEVWNDLADIEIEAHSSDMDDKFYEELSKFNNNRLTEDQGKVIPINNTSKIISLRNLGIAMTFLLGLALGNFFDLPGSKTNGKLTQVQTQQEDLIRFASLKHTPKAGERIKGIIKAKLETNPNQKILAALNEVLCNDPNVNVRLTAIETLVLFWDIPEAREILIKAIPLQDSPIVQMELADVMISLGASSSSNKWNQLLDSGRMDPDIKSQLENTLKELL